VYSQNNLVVKEAGMLRSARFRNYKALAEVDLDLEPLTVFVGPNNSGKTSILEGLYGLSQLIDNLPEQVFEGPNHYRMVYRRGGEGSLELSATSSGGTLRLEVSPPTMPLLTNTAGAATGWQPTVLARKDDSPGQGWLPPPAVPSVRQALRGTTFLRLSARRLAEPSYADAPGARLGQDGEGLASALAHLALNRPDDFAALQESLRKIIKEVKRIRFERVPVVRMETEMITVGQTSLPRQIRREYVGEALVFDFHAADAVPAQHVSGGTLLVLGLLTALAVPSPSGILLVDELEQGLHPLAQQELVAHLQQMVAGQAARQILATTHSPYLLDHLRPEQVRLTTCRADGTVACARLDAHPQFARWKDEMTPGEFWGSVGESWVANGEPARSR
jgi:predicted ATPase